MLQILLYRTRKRNARAFLIWHYFRHNGYQFRKKVKKKEIDLKFLLKNYTIKIGRNLEFLYEEKWKIYFFSYKLLQNGGLQNE